MKSIEDKLDRRIREQKLICALNEALLEHYKAIKSPTAGLEQVGRKGETDDKENSAYGCIIPA